MFEVILRVKFSSPDQVLAFYKEAKFNTVQGLYMTGNSSLVDITKVYFQIRDQMKDYITYINKALDDGKTQEEILKELEEMFRTHSEGGDVCERGSEPDRNENSRS